MKRSRFIDMRSDVRYSFTVFLIDLYDHTATQLTYKQTSVSTFCLIKLVDGIQI